MGLLILAVALLPIFASDATATKPKAPVETITVITIRGVPLGVGVAEKRDTFQVSVPGPFIPKGAVK